MIKYKCGHESKGMIIAKGDILTMAEYMVWKDSVGFQGDKSMCFECYCKKNHPKSETKSKQLKGR